MAYINIFVANDAHINVKNNQLMIKGSGKEESFPLEDVSSVLIENLRTTISTATLSLLAENNAIVYFCDKNHMPNAYLLPFYSHYNQTKMYRIQSEISVPLKKTLWKDIVVHKIQNQDLCLKICDIQSPLFELSKQVKSGDTSNLEAVAANKYFKLLFGSKFTRQEECNTNSALNYGYAIIRGAVARNVVSHGLLPFIGLNHDNIFNNYNLADDLMEVFRPFVDLYVKTNEDVVFNTSYKVSLCNLLNCNCKINGGKYTLSYAIELFVQSYVNSLSSGENELKFPILSEISAHEFM